MRQRYLLDVTTKVLTGLHPVKTRPAPSFLRPNGRLRPELYVEKFWGVIMSEGSAMLDPLPMRNRPVQQVQNATMWCWLNIVVIALRVVWQTVPSLPRASHIVRFICVRFLTNEDIMATGAAKEKRRWSRELRVSDICHPTPGARSPEEGKKLRAARIRTGVVWRCY